MKIHKTKDGETMLIAEMEDQHLLNTITVMCKGIKALTVIKPGNLLDRALHSRQEMSEEDRLEKIREVDEKLGDYVLEAAIRGMEVTEMLRKTYGRQNAVSKTSQFCLGSGDDCIEIDVDDTPF